MSDPTAPQRTNTDAPAREPRLVVGLGAAAGGAEALREFFAALPAGSGLAYVVVLHPNPDGQSPPAGWLDGIPLPVVEIADGMPVQADRIHVVPPGLAIGLEGVRFRVAGAPEAGGPIDAFFHALADARGDGAVAAVFSGQGADGTHGLKAVSDAGGLTFAQDPATARYDAMPRNAAAYGAADRVLPPGQMPAELLAYAKHVRALADGGTGAELHRQIEDSLATICDALLRETDHNFKHYKTSTLVRRVGRRMQILRVPTAAEYADRLAEDRDEALALFRELLIGVTAFFRDPDAFEALARDVLPKLFAGHGPDPVRVWVPGCATGEEAYTLAILLREQAEKQGSSPEVQVFATDINERALAAARQGSFPLAVAEDLSPERLGRFFLKKGSRYHVVKEVRELVLFSAHDLIRDPPFSRLDLVSCRNLLIYLGPHLQKKLIPLFHYALRPGGSLFLGPSESLSDHRDLFRPVDAKHRISQRLPTAARPAPILDRADGVRGPRTAEGPAPEPDLHAVMQRIVLDEFAPRTVIVNEEGQILCASGGLEKYLAIAAGTFRNNVVKLARGGLRVALRAALAEAIKTRRTVENDAAGVKTAEGTTRVRLFVQPMPQLGEQSGLFLIAFQDVGPTAGPDDARPVDGGEQTDTLFEQLERELRTTRDDLEKSIQDLEAANEELKSGNEELLSMNEELQSANEELETSKEAVQAANEALARANSDLENLLTSTQIATVFLDDRRTIQRFTPAMTAVYNLLPADVGRPLADITHRAGAMPPLPDPKSLRCGPPHPEEEVRTADGRWYVRRVLPYRTGDGRQEGMVVTFSDITDLKQTEAALRASEERYALAIRGSNDGIWDWDPRAGGRHLSDRCLEILGFGPGEVVDGEAAWEAVVHPDDKGRVLELRRRHLELRERYDCEYRIVTPAGEQRWVRSRGQALWDESGSPVRMAGSMTDVTERRRAEEAVAASERRFRELADAMPQMVWSARPDGCLDYYNERWYEFTGFPRGESGDASWEPILHPDDVARCSDTWYAAVRSGRQYQIEYRFFDRATGAYRWHLGRALPARGPAGTITRWYGTCTDIDDQKRAEEGLRAADQQKDEFLAMLAHELRNPLAPVLHAAEVLRQRGDDPHEARRQADTIDRQVRQMKRLLDDLLDVARITRGKVDLRRETFDLRAALEAAAEAIRPAADARKHALAVELPGEPLAVDGDAARLTQVFTNLLANAVKYTPEGGRIRGAAIRDGTEAVVRVADTGAGMTPDLIARAFDLFAQGDQALDRAEGGLGIGLTLVSRLVELHGGVVTAASPGPGRGSEFTVRLPLASRGCQPPGPEASQDRGVDTPRSPLRILIVDDNVDAAETLALLLRHLGHTVMTAYDGLSAVAAAAALGPRAVLCDIGLPRMDGFQVAAKLRELPQAAGALLVAVTGYGEESIRRRAAAAGFDRLLVKPVEFGDVLELLRAAAGTPQSR